MVILAISEPGYRPPEKKSHLEPGLNQRDRATGGFVRVYTHRKPGKIFDVRGFGARMRCPGAPVLCLSPLLVALLLTRLVIRSGQSHPGFYTQPHQPGSGRRVTPLARSDHSAATEEPAPSVTLPPTSVHVIVWWCGDTPVVRAALERSDFAVRRLPLIFAWK